VKRASRKADDSKNGKTMKPKNFNGASRNKIKSEMKGSKKIAIYVHMAK
jgi:hypothetical protein